MLEKMDVFFENRLAGYDEHMLNDIEGAGEFYPYTASLLPREAGVAILDLGCGTGLELEAYLSCNPHAHITGIDLSRAMLDRLREKFPKGNLQLIRGSYFDVDLGVELFDAAVSVESLHHFTEEKKLALYRKLFRALKTDGYFVLTDYFAPSEAFEKESFETLERLKREQGISDDGFYHYDTPLTVEHETALLRDAGFSEVRILKNWGATCTILAKRSQKTVEAHIEAHKFCGNHMEALKKDKVCGCFYCLSIFSPEEINEWLIDDNDADRLGTAICPHCGIDSVIGESSGYPITKEFLQKMYEHWF